LLIASIENVLIDSDLHEELVSHGAICNGIVHMRLTNNKGDVMIELEAKFKLYNKTCPYTKQR